MLGSQAQLVWTYDHEFQGQVKSVEVIEKWTPPYFGIGGAYIKDGDDKPVMLPPTPIIFYTTRYLEYDSHGRMINQIQMWNFVDTLGQCFCDYDKQGRISERREYRESSRLELTRKYEYPDSLTWIDHMITPPAHFYNTRVVELHPDDLLRIKYNLNNGVKDNYVISELNEDLNTLSWRYGLAPESRLGGECFYDSRGRKLRCETSLPNANPAYCEVEEFDKDGRLAVVTLFYDSGRKTTKRYSYDAQGNVLTEDVECPESWCQSHSWYEYEFNEYGDWIRMSKFRGTDVNWRYHGESVLREISYY